jgi:hypothetical protein
LGALKNPNDWETTLPVGKPKPNDDLVAGLPAADDNDNEIEKWILEKGEWRRNPEYEAPKVSGRPIPDTERLWYYRITLGLVDNYIHASPVR